MFLVQQQPARSAPPAFATIVREHQAMVYSIGWHFLRDRAVAEELAQDVFLKVHKGLPYFRGEAKLSTWIYRIVVNVLSQERPELASVSLDDTDDDRPRREPAADDRSFGDLVMKDRLQKAIERLPIQYQVLVNGHYMKGMRYEDLAEALELPMGTVKTHLHRAKRRLRELLETEFR